MFAPFTTMGANNTVITTLGTALSAGCVQPSAKLMVRARQYCTNAMSAVRQRAPEIPKSMALSSPLIMR